MNANSCSSLSEPCRSPRAAAWAALTVLTWAAVAADLPKPADVAAANADSEPPWKTLFDGRTLNGWKVTPFAGHGEVEVKDGRILLPMGAMLTGVSYTNDLPKLDYEVSLEAMKIEGSDFFCGLTFPVSNAFCTLIVGGWGGGIVGLSSIDGYDASENEATKYLSFEKGRWYAIRLKVTKAKIEAWIDKERVISQAIVGRRISLRPGEIEASIPFGIATYQVTGALRNIQMRPVETLPGPSGAAQPPPK
jgi:hypothetical protein